MGSVITGSWQFGLAYRAERRTRRAASRMVAAELRSLYQELWMPAAIDPALHLLSDISVELSAWEAYNGALAMELSSSEWFAVANAYEGLKSLEGMRKIDFAQMPDEESRKNMRQWARTVALNVRAGIEILEKIEPNIHRPQLMDLPNVD